MLINHTMKTLFLVFISTISFQTFSNDNSQGSLITDSNEELVLFFSYHCQACSDISNAVNLWAISNKVNIKKVPVVSKEWEPGARLYFLIELTKDIHYLNQYQRFSSGFSILNMIENMPVDEVGFASLLRQFSMEISPLTFKERWGLSEIMLESSKDIINDAPELIDVPSVRYFNGNEVYWLRPNKDETSFDFISRIEEIRINNE